MSVYSANENGNSTSRNNLATLVIIHERLMFDRRLLVCTGEKRRRLGTVDITQSIEPQMHIVSHTQAAADSHTLTPRTFLRDWGVFAGCRS